MKPETQTKFQVQKLSMHRYVLTCVGLLFVIMGTFPLAYFRVSNSEKFEGVPFNSLTLEQNQRPALRVQQ